MERIAPTMESKEMKCEKKRSRIAARKDKWLFGAQLGESYKKSTTIEKRCRRKELCQQQKRDDP